MSLARSLDSHSTTDATFYKARAAELQERLQAQHAIISEQRAQMKETRRLQERSLSQNERERLRAARAAGSGSGSGNGSGDGNGSGSGSGNGNGNGSGSGSGNAREPNHAHAHAGARKGRWVTMG